MAFSIKRNNINQILTVSAHHRRWFIWLVKLLFICSSEKFI